MRETDAVVVIRAEGQMCWVRSLSLMDLNDRLLLASWS